ncbi:MAG: NAD(P)-dependent oxidoreductase [Actinomycetes bacterium]
MRISFVGLGNMGGSMSRNLAAAGLDVTVFDLDTSKADRAVAAGAALAGSVAEAVAKADVLITMLPTPPAVEDVLVGSGGALEALPDNALWVDMSTSVPAVADRVRERGASKGLRVLDAPVSGMAKGADAGTLQIFVGGDASDAEEARPLFDVMGDPQRVFHVGAHGAGYSVKLMLNLLWFNYLVSTAEVLTIGAKAGVDLSVLHRSLVASPANSVLLERDFLPLLTEGDYDEGFAIALACKDLGLAVDLARSVGVPVELSAVVEQVFRRARATYGDRAGEMTPVKLYEDVAGQPLRLG